MEPEQLGLLASLHDLGKASPAFQLKRPELILGLRDQVSWPHAEKEAAGDPAVSHGIVGAAVLRQLLAERFGVGEEVSVLLADALGGHHGWFASSAQCRAAGEGKRKRWSGQADRGWNDLRLALVDQLSGAFPVDDGVDLSLSLPQAYVFAGLVTVADWIGSNEEWFPYAPEEGFESYSELMKRRAEAAIRTLGFVRWEPTAASFEERFGFAPRPLQRVTACTGRMLGPSGEPAVVVVEAEMGSGKTESAFDLAAEMVSGGLASGVFVALPTRATANQMFERATRFLESNTADRTAVVNLVHGLAQLDTEFDRLLHSAAPTVVPSSVFDEPGTQVRADEWFTRSKRSLLAPWGVGTVDSVLTGAMRLRHGAVRMFGLADKVVVIDEVHAYDVYMSTLLDRLLQWFGRLGVPVILLSATLPADRRRELLSAWAGREISGGDGYPLVSWATRDRDGHEITEPARRSNVRLEVRWGAMEPPEVAGLLVEGVGRGGCVAAVCNTVGRAQELYREVLRLVGDDPVEVVLLHARFPFDERMERERKVLSRFGPVGERPERAILIATQVVEQSLDLDFDLLISDLAPVDLLLQRMGRLHRHERLRPPHLQDPTFIVVGVDRDADGRVDFAPGSVSVYGEYLLVKTAAALDGLATVSIPDDLPNLVEAVYSEDHGDTGAFARQAQEARRAFDDEREREMNEAQARYIPPPEKVQTLADMTRMPGEEQAAETQAGVVALTRLGAETIDVVLVTEDGGRLAAGPGGPAFERDDLPDERLARRLLGRAVSLSHRGLLQALRDESPPEAWQRSPWLRHHRLLVLDRSGHCRVGRWDVVLDGDLGVVIRESGAD
jgi:CRISPR-associated endonuclease/helicase Cas3